MENNTEYIGYKTAFQKELFNMTETPDADSKEQAIEAAKIQHSICRDFIRAAG